MNDRKRIEVASELRGIRRQLPVPTLVFQIHYVYAVLATGNTRIAMIITRGTQASPGSGYSGWTAKTQQDKESWFTGTSPSSWPDDILILCEEERGGANPGQLPGEWTSFTHRGYDTIDASTGWSSFTGNNDSKIYKPTEVFSRDYSSSGSTTSPIADTFAVSFDVLTSASPALHWYRSDTSLVTPYMVPGAGGSAVAFNPKVGDYVAFRSRSAIPTSGWQIRGTALST